MLAASIFNTVEFYVIAAVVAAAVVAASALPRRRGPVRTFFFEGALGQATTPFPAEPAIEITVDDAGQLRIVRRGLAGISMSGACNLAVEIAGFDVTLHERLTPEGRRWQSTQDAGEGMPAQAACASFVLDCFGRERYHFRYQSDATRRSCAFSMTVAPGARLLRPLEV